MGCPRIDIAVLNGNLNQQGDHCFRTGEAVADGRRIVISQYSSKTTSPFLERLGLSYRRIQGRFWFPASSVYKTLPVVTALDGHLA